MLKAGGALVVSIGMPIGLDTVLGIGHGARARRDKPPLMPDQLSSYHRGQCRRHRLRLLRQDGHGPGPVRRHRPDGGRRARRAVQGRHRDHGRHRHQREPGRRLGLDRHPARRQADAHGRGRGAPRAGRDGGGEARPAGRRAHRHRRRRARQERCVEEGVLCRADRRALLQRPARLEQAVGQHALCPRQGQAEGPEGLQDRRPADPARGHRAQGLRAGRLLHRRQGAGHGAWPHDPAGGRRRGAGQGRRKLDQGHPRRQGGLGQGLPRRRRRQGMGRDQGGAEAQGRMVGRQAAVPRPGRALRPHPQGAGAQARGRRQADRQCRRRLQDRRARDRGRVRMAVPVPCLHGTGLRPGRDQGRQRHLLDRLAEVALRAGRHRALARHSAGEGARDLDDRPRLLRPQRCRRCRHGCRRPGQGGRQAGAGAIHARPGDRMGPEGPRLDPPRARGHRRLRQRHRLRVHQQGLLAHRRQHQWRQAVGHAGGPVPAAWR